MFSVPSRSLRRPKFACPGILPRRLHLQARRSGVRLAASVAVLALPVGSYGWGHNGHSLINRLAVEKLPATVPEFLRSASAQTAMAYYGPEPDHWRSLAEPELSATGAPDHFIDMEYADLIGNPLPRRRYDYLRALAYAQKSHPDLALTPEKVGMQPYAATEGYERLKSAMRDYRELEKAHRDTRPVECEIIYLAGILGHFVADGSQPLHVTYRYNGWTGPNPQGYTTLHTIHAQFESDFVDANVQARDIAPLVAAEPTVIDDVFADYMAYLKTSQAKVEELYRLEKGGGFTGQGSAQSRVFADRCIAAGVTELRDLIVSAWVHSADPVPVSKGG